jgi:hypothetical protein
MSMTSGGQAYLLSGDREKELEQHVGQRVEIIGRVEGGAGASSGYSGSGTTASGTASGTTGSGTAATGSTSGTGSATASGTPTGAGTTTGASAAGSASAQGNVGDLKELTIVSFRAVGGSCPSPK